MAGTTLTTYVGLTMSDAERLFTEHLPLKPQYMHRWGLKPTVTEVPLANATVLSWCEFKSRMHILHVCIYIYNIYIYIYKYLSTFLPHMHRLQHFIVVRHLLGDHSLHSVPQVETSGRRSASLLGDFHNGRYCVLYSDLMSFGSHSMCLFVDS